MRGFVYVMTNPAMPGVVKIGFSTKDPSVRASDLSGTSVPQPFSVYYDVLVADPFSIEQLLHSRLREVGSGAGKEFFSLHADAAVAAIRTQLADLNLVPLHESRTTYHCKQCKGWSFQSECDCNGSVNERFERAMLHLDEDDFERGLPILADLASLGRADAAFELALAKNYCSPDLDPTASKADDIGLAEVASNQGYVPASRWLARHYQGAMPSTEEAKRKGSMYWRRVDPSSDAPKDRLSLLTSTADQPFSLVDRIQSNW